MQIVRKNQDDLDYFLLKKMLPEYITVVVVVVVINNRQPSDQVRKNCAYDTVRPVHNDADRKG